MVTTANSLPPNHRLNNDNHEFNEEEDDDDGDDGDHDDDDTIRPICVHHARLVKNFLESEATSPLLKRVQAQTRTALTVIQTALKRYSLEEISLSYNGGKDCLVLLILLLSAILFDPMRTKISRLPRRLHSVYIIASYPFPEVDTFVESSASNYRLDLVRYSMPMKAAFARYLDDHKKIKAILVGTRRTDPHGRFLNHFDQTDSGWPPFMRIHPVIDWNYAEIWTFIRELGIPYCNLYDRGFTSLGGTIDTRPNPALKIDDNLQKFKPAYELMDDDAERLGRDDSGQINS